jgi:hypothetical protein
MRLWEAGESTEHHVAPSSASVKSNGIPTVKVISSKKKRSKPRKIQKKKSSKTSGAGNVSGSTGLTTGGGSSLGRGSSSLSRSVGGAQSNHWGRATDVYGDADYMNGALDKNDPNYDSQEDDSHYYDVRQTGSGAYQTYQTHGYGMEESGSPPRNNYQTARRASSTSSSTAKTILSLPEYKVTVIQFLSEYFVSGDRLEVERCMRETWIPDFHFEMVKRTITMAMDRNARGCEAASLLLSFLHGRSILTTDEVGKGIERLFEVIDDLTVDVPNASRLLSQFVARAVVDELLPPIFLTDPTVVNLGGAVIHDAVTLLSVKHGQVRVEKVWGPGASEFSDDLKRVIKLILAEFLDTKDVHEAALSIRLLEAPRYNHELVKRALVMGVDCTADDQILISVLFNHLVQVGLMTIDQLLIGFHRTYNELNDLILDCPNAPYVLNEFVTRAKESRIMARSSTFV